MGTSSDSVLVSPCPVISSASSSPSSEVLGAVPSPDLVDFDFFDFLLLETLEAVGGPTVPFFDDLLVFPFPVTGGVGGW